MASVTLNIDSDNLANELEWLLHNEPFMRSKGMRVISVTIEGIPDKGIEEIRKISEQEDR